jgi:CRP/FNR family transcriptional regulator, cyclic AMP receptor protein
MAELQTLKACSLFRGFTDPGLITFAKIARERTIPKGTPIFVENMVAESLFILKSGVVQLNLRQSDGQEKVLDKLLPGDSFGELSLLVGGHRMVSAMAETDCETVEITRRDFANLQKQKPQACIKLMLNIINRFNARLAAAKDHLKPLLLAQLGG